MEIAVKSFKRCSVIVAQVFIGLLCSGCEPAPEKYHYGSIYFGAGSYLGKFDLREGGSTIAASVGNANIRQVNPLYGNRLLLMMDAIEDEREIAKISWLDTRTLQMTALYAGVAAAWVPDLYTYIYDDGSRLAAASTHPDFETDAVIMRHRVNDVSRIITISGTAVLFQVGYRDSSEVWRYDAERADLTKLEALTGVCDLRHAVWLAADQRLACAERDTGAYVLTTLDGEVTGRLPLPKDKQLAAVAWVHDQRLIVFSESWRAQMGGRLRNAVWVHEVDTGAFRRLVDNQYLGDSAVYRAD